MITLEDNKLYVFSKENAICFTDIMSWEMPPRFVERLRDENCWTHDYAAKCIDEYKKFMLLAAVSPKAVTPSDEIDQVWHLHVIHMRDYSKFCTLLEKVIIHGPTEGGEKEDARYLEQYNYTRGFYWETFSYTPPEEFWPHPDIRFSGVFGRINFNSHLVIKTSDYPRLTKFFSFLLKIFR
jgi:hypothetical protein